MIGTNVKAFLGTLKVHQVVYKKSWPKLHFRSLSCFACLEKECDHFSMGQEYKREHLLSENSVILEESIDELDISNRGMIFY